MKHVTHDKLEPTTQNNTSDERPQQDQKQFEIIRKEGTEEGEETYIVLDRRTGIRRYARGEIEGLERELTKGLLTTAGVLGGATLWEGYAKWRAAKDLSAERSGNNDTNGEGAGR